MKYLIYFILFTAMALLVYNASLLDFDHPFGEESSTALAGVVAALCVIVLMFILMVSRAIQKRVNETS